MKDNISAVAQIRQEIEATCSSMNQLFHGFAQKAPHWVVRMQYQTLDNNRDRLAQLVGDQEATETLCETYNKIIQ